jgi:hypothetical protein
VVNVSHHPVLENLGSGSGESGGSGTFLWSVFSSIVVLDGTRVAKRSHLLLSGKSTEASFVILTDNIQGV